jgi:hypothetical protein
MCIKILNADSAVQYDSSRPLEEQLYGSREVVIHYEPKDPHIDRFIDEMERMCKTGVSCNVNVNVIHNNNLKGIRAKKQVKRLMKNLELNEAIKILANLQHKTDITLGEISDLCLRVTNNE